ncbi:peptidoglycan DD-metalloendopeptidase family protein, partial [Salmonella enterica]|uniref:peptidoglycan DD-metalloendopeptidase family protein n=1 Tax=Salmonella enterica TaxID=28901 RepID=UPI002A75BC58
MPPGSLNGPVKLTIARTSELSHRRTLLLSHYTYAHNDTMLVREQQEVKAGQKIATMGSTGTSSTRLHFEIRYKGKSVNPLRYLPQR